MSLAPSSSGFRLRGWHVLAMIVAFFAVIVGVDVSFAVVAMRTFPGQVAKNPYEDGIAFNRKVAEHAAQSRLGWRAAAGVGDDGAVAVRVVDRSGAPVVGLTAQGKLERPATEAESRSPAFVETAPGTYVARPGDLGGSWDLTFLARDAAGHRFEAVRRLTWP